MSRFKKGTSYLISFMDTRQLEYTWYCGEGVYIKRWHDDFGEKETHHLFHLPNGDECVFPRSSISVK